MTTREVLIEADHSVAVFLEKVHRPITSFQKNDIGPVLLHLFPDFGKEIGAYSLIPVGLLHPKQMDRTAVPSAHARLNDGNRIAFLVQHLLVEMT